MRCARTRRAAAPSIQNLRQPRVRSVSSDVGRFAPGATAPPSPTSRHPPNRHRGSIMFSKLCLSLLVFAVALVPAASVRADAAPTKDEVVAQVKKAVDFFKTNGREKTLAELNKKDGMFAKGEDYVD